MSLTISEFFKLTKPGVLYLLMITAGASMILATNFNLDIIKALTGFLGIAFIAGSSAAINQILDFKYDSVMERTVKRPIVTGKISVTSATVFASFLFIAGSALILYFNNFLTWVLTFGTWIFYAFFYTKVLKFSGSQNIVIGGLAGAMPPLLGWTAVVGSIDPLPLLLVLLIFIWTPPHFWALAINKKDEYAKAGIPMMPVVKGIEYTKIQIVLYSILLMVVSLLLFATGYFGYLYLIGAVILGGIFIQKSWKLKKSTGADNSMSLFLYSIVYLTLIFLLMIVDRAVVTYV
ncbi:MAG: protoheme IX farnesyltransferase [Gammaproteobacteria bacterium]|jgi:protoheme IX farnesyltransferase|nr:protoheme IX farnesyltransferase [Gammaproteobacteria bacterium]|tara:strand:- start:2462 stop:3334 length:873 start_codon:yes stop_codon:yes gene_type:complete